MTWTSGGTSRTSTTAGKRFRATVLRRDDHRCQKCGYHDPTGMSLEADHIINHAQGGTDDPDNGQTLCKRCHRNKTAKESAHGRRTRTKRGPLLHPGTLEPSR